MHNDLSSTRLPRRRSARSLALAAGLALAGCSAGPDGAAELMAAQPVKSAMQGLAVGSCAVNVQPLRSIEIVHPNVVNDARASNSGAGAWSFRTLIERMAPAGQTDAFLRGVFESWEVNQQINGETVAARPSVSQIINTFAVPGTSPRQFELANAPFRLIAVASRLDLRDATTAGEGRFIYALTSGPGGTGFPLSMTIIFEYKLPLAGDLDTPLKWAEAWHELDALDPATNAAAFNARLQQITDAFTAANAFPGRPNGSAISQLRTNEIQLGSPWQLREFNMNAAGFMVPATVKGSPNQALNETPLLASFINANPALSATSDTSFLSVAMPQVFNGQPFLGGKSDVGVRWRLPGEDPQFSVRADNFGLLTCNGCHQDNKPPNDLAFYHVSPTSPPGADGTGRLSLFMTQGEPSKGGRRPAELVRRAQDVGELLCSGQPTDIRRTVVFVFGPTAPGQDLFIRGGLDHGAAQQLLGRTCTADNMQCAIPIVHRNRRNGTTDPWKAQDTFLDWYGRQPGQDGVSSGALADGTAADWTTDLWRFGAPARTVAIDGFGEEPLNHFGEHFWMLDVDMDCSKAFLDPRDGTTRWFELKSFIARGSGWEADVTQADRPYPSSNHFAKCGKVSVFERGSSGVQYFDL